MRLGTPAGPSIRMEPFYAELDFDHLKEMTPPEIHPYIPASMGEPEFYSDITPGFDKQTQSRLFMQSLTEKKKYTPMLVNKPFF